MHSFSSSQYRIPPIRTGASLTVYSAPMESHVSVVMGEGGGGGPKV